MVRIGWFTREKLLVGSLVGVIIILFIVYALWEKEPDPGSIPIESYQATPAQKELKPTTQEKEPQEVIIDVKGAVKLPGIYQLSDKARVFQAIERAGGILPTADLNQVNLAEPLTDGMVIYIPKKGEEGSPIWGNSTHSQTFSQSQPNKVNINRATVTELQQLTGVGPSKAEAIIKYREENGPFQSVDELTQVPGIGEKTLEKFRDQVSS